MDRCSAITVSGHEDFSSIRSLGNPEKALVNLSMTTLDPHTSLDVIVKDALKQGITEDEIQDIVNFAWAAGHQSRATELSQLVTRHRNYQLPQTSIVKLNDHETLVHDSAPNSTGIPIVLLHALSMDASMWRAISPTLSQNSRVIAYDIRGFGHASAAPPPSSITQVADDLNRLLCQLNIPKADIYGISYGGVIAQVFALNHPSLTRSVAILASLPKGIPILLDRATAAEDNGMESLVPATLIRWFSPEIIASNNWAVRYARTCIRRCSVASWATAWRVMADFDVVDRLHEIKVPVLAMAGSKDVSSPPALLKIIAEKTGGKYVEIENGTHLMNMEMPEAVVRVLKDFRNQVDEQTK